MIAALSLSLLLFRQAEPGPVDSVDCTSEVVLPFQESARQAPCINLEIGGKTYKFALDTGAVGGRISPEIVQALGLNPIGEVHAGDPSGKNTRLVHIYKIPEIKAGDVTLHGVQMFADDGVVPHDMKAYFDGVIGYAVFKDLLLSIDYPKRQVILDPGGMSPDQLKQSIPYSLEHGIPFLEVHVGKVDVWGHVDTGADGGLSIPAKYKTDLNLDGDPVKVGTAKTLFNSVDIYLAKVKDRITVGGVAMPIHEVELNDLFPMANIGGRVLKNFKVVIDQKAHRILFGSPS